MAVCKTIIENIAFVFTLSGQLLAQSGMGSFAVYDELADYTPTDILNILMWGMSLATVVVYTDSQHKRIHHTLGNLSLRNIFMCFYTTEELRLVNSYKNRHYKKYRLMMLLAVCSAVINGISGVNGVSSLSLLSQDFSFFEKNAIAVPGGVLSGIATFIFYTPKALSRLAGQSSEPKVCRYQFLTVMSVLTTSLLTVALADAAFSKLLLWQRIGIASMFLCATAPMNYYAFDSSFYPNAFDHWLYKNSTEHWNSWCDKAFGVSKLMCYISLLVGLMVLNFSVAFNYIILDIQGVDNLAVRFVVSPLLSLPASLGQVNVMFGPSQEGHNSDDKEIEEAETPVTRLVTFLGSIFTRCRKRFGDAHDRESALLLRDSSTGVWF